MAHHVGDSRHFTIWPAAALLSPMSTSRDGGPSAMRQRRLVDAGRALKGPKNHSFIIAIAPSPKVVVKAVENVAARRSTEGARNCFRCA